MHTPEPPKIEQKFDDEGNPIDPEPEAEENKVDLTPKLQKHIYPESVISLKATDQMLRRRAKMTMLN